MDIKCIVEAHLNLPSNQTPAATPPMITSKTNRRGPLLFADAPLDEDTLDASRERA